MILRKDLYEKLETMQNLLIAHATGSPSNEREYQELRLELLSEEAISSILPGFIRTSRRLDQFLAFVRKNRPSYAERREYLWKSFAPVFDHLENESGMSMDVKDDLPMKPVSAPHMQNTKKRKGTIKAFISYSTRDKLYGAQIKRILEAYAIECFLAHEDLEVSEEWKSRIFEELQRCDIFIPLLSRAFHESDWAPQEVGVVIARQEVAIIPLSIDGTIPFGFISHVQSKRISDEGVTENLIIAPLVRKYPHAVIPGMIQKVSRAGSYRGAEAAMKPLVTLYPILDDDELDALVKASIDNDQVWSASLCNRDYLPKLIEVNKHRIDKEKLKALEYQVENNEWYQGKRGLTTG
jgi:hypothetical protein